MLYIDESYHLRAHTSLMPLLLFTGDGACRPADPSSSPPRGGGGGGFGGVGGGRPGPAPPAVDTAEPMRGPHDGARCDAAQLGPAAVLHDGPDMSDGPRAAPGVDRWAAAFNPADSDP